MGYAIEHNVRRAANYVAIELLLGIVAIIVVSLLPDANYAFSVTFCVYYIATLLSVWRSVGNKVTPFFLFLLTVGLFYGGTFIGKLMHGIDEMFAIDFFVTYTCTHEEKKELTIFLISFITAISCGYLKNYADKSFLQCTASSKSSTKDYTKLTSLISGAFWILAPVLILDVLWNYISVSQNGYVSLYKDLQNGVYSSDLVGWAKTLFMIFLGLAFGFCSKKIQIHYLTVYVVRSLVIMAMGARGALGTMMLFLFWIYSLYRNISLKELFLYCLIAIAVLILGLSLSVRAQDNDIAMGGGIWNKLSSFISGQGISLMVFEVSRSIEDYPTLAYLQTLIPGVSTIYSLFSGVPVLSYENNMSNYMCHTLNSALYEEGFGMGWSLMSDLYLFGGRRYVVFVILSWLFGFGLSKIELKAFSNPWVKSLLITIVMPLLILPRSSLNSFSTVIIYTLFVYLFLHVFVSKKRKGYSQL